MSTGYSISTQDTVFIGYSNSTDWVQFALNFSNEKRTIRIRLTLRPLLPGSPLVPDWPSLPCMKWKTNHKLFKEINWDVNECAVYSLISFFFQMQLCLSRHSVISEKILEIRYLLLTERPDSPIDPGGPCGPVRPCSPLFPFEPSLPSSPGYPYRNTKICY